MLAAPLTRPRGRTARRHLRRRPGAAGDRSRTTTRR
jgi:hypothetical protein